MSGLGTTRTNVLGRQYAEDAGNMTYITTAKKTYSKYHLPRIKKDGRHYKICRSDKKNIPTTKNQSYYMCETSSTTKPKVVA